jgi:lactate dehydrogenase-like 2-hydroxyacid dehydrogenase
VNARLAKLDSVVLLPHLGSATAATRERMATLALTDAARVLRGDGPLHPIRSA